ncbi:hypothetical protein [Phaeovulum vinaykumarii]|uniref:Uncharacterized protein n=1 Tax=Phaeovulum vinaykumarii TaxID=407234 RepID=A0A1N7MN79_9RHOB|nr:hypothetical protein [Phaeovulum vinaykumarii]SIS87595.1 hypothetical protein SAMN05421795_108125 [Phaeovulum vinaykumarii]SOC13057.1 hypothetical protein SAMN05878426_10821 [Phaeovulum vinaykumarii]
MRPLALALLLASPAAAADFVPPAGCTLAFTAQLHGCVVSNTYSCVSDAPGDRRTSYADGEGVFFTSHIDRETRWIESTDHETGEIDRLLPDAADHASFSTLLATGVDTYDFETLSNAGERRRYRGVDRLTGERVVIDGITLERAEFEIETLAADGSFISRRTGSQFISRDWRIFFGDREHYENAFGDQVDTLEAPVTFALPGEEGFGAAEPEYDCTTQMTGVPAKFPRPTL